MNTAENDVFSGWCILRALDTDLQNRHFDVIIREIKPRSIEVKKNICFCGSGKKAAECHAEISDNTAMSYLFEAFRLIDRDIANTVRAPVCPKNCTECCEYSFEVSAAEYFAILRYIQTRFTGFQTMMLKRNAMQQLPKFPAIKDTSAYIGTQFAPCIFLDNRRGCRIYEVRPLICRMYGYFANLPCPKVSTPVRFLSGGYEHLDSFLSDQISKSGIIKPPIAVPMVYWFGSNVMNNAAAKQLFMIAHEQGIDKYIEFSIHADFNEWFAV
jgi:Fe-S-cluster containining protein